MRVLLIQSWTGPKGGEPVFPLGLAYVGTALSVCGHEARIVDANVMDDLDAGLRRAIEAHRPECIGLSLRNIDNQNRADLEYAYLFFRETLRRTARWAGDIPLVVGGAGFSMFPEEVMRHNPELTAGCHLEAEESFPELLDRLDDPSTVKGVFARKDGNVVFGGERPLPDFGRLPFPDRRLADLDAYRKRPFSMGVQTKRGCPLTCAYCNYPYLNGPRYRLRAPEHVADEIRYLVQDLEIRTFTFADSVFNQPLSYSASILEELKRRDLSVEWGAYMHVKGMTRAYIDQARSSGCVSMLFSPDGHSQEALDGLNKGLTAHDVEALFDRFKREKGLEGLHVGFCLFLNPPGETWRGLLGTLLFFVRALLSRFRPGTARMRAYVGWIRLEPHTAVYERALAEGTWSKDRTLLPLDAQGLRKTFYRHPRLGWTDAALLAFFRALRMLETLARRLKRKGHPS